MSYGIESYGVGSYGAPAEQAGGSVTLVIQDVSQAQAIENLTLSANGAVDLSIQDATQAQSIESPTLSMIPVVDFRVVPTGDSNASGRGSFSQTNSAANAYLFNNSGVVTALADPYDAPPNTYSALDDSTSAAGSYVQHLADLLDASGRSVMFIPANKGGTLSSGWTSTAAGTAYAAMKARVIEAGGDGADLVFLIHLGANDANSSVPQATFKANIETLVGSLNTDFPLAKKYLQKVHHFSSAPAGTVDTIRAGVEDVLNGSSGCLRGADLDGITTNIHYGATGVPATCTSELNEVALRTYGAVFGVDLTVADVSQAQAIDAPDLSFETSLVVADVAQAQAIDPSSLTTESTLTVNQIDQAQLIDAAALGTDSALAVDGVSQAQAIDAIVLNTANMVDLTIQSVSTGQYIDAIALSDEVLLAIQSIHASQSVGAIALSTLSELNILGIVQEQYADTLVLNIPSAGGGTYPTAEEIASALIAALNATTIPVDVHKVLTSTVSGRWPTAEQNADALLSRTWP